MVRSFAVLLFVSLSSIATATSEEALAYRCDDVVVIGRLQNLSYEHVEIENDLLGHGWMTANVRVKKVVRGTSSNSILPVRYFGHTYMRQDRDFLFVLRPAQEGYTVASARLMKGKPRLAARCS